MNTWFSPTPYLVFFGGLAVLGLILLLSQLDKCPTDEELDQPLPPPES